MYVYVWFAHTCVRVCGLELRVRVAKNFGERRSGVVGLIRGGKMGGGGISYVWVELCGQCFYGRW